MPLSPTPYFLGVVHQGKDMITAQAIINLPAIQHNYQQLSQKCQGKPVIAVIKGDAYGHNAIEVAKALPNATMFAVSRIEEAIELREAGITQPVLLLEGCFCQDDLKTAAKLHFHSAIHCQEQLDDLLAVELDAPIALWLKVDTGMHRIGVEPAEVAHYVTQIEASGQCQGDLGFMSHFSCADDTSASTTTQQIECFLNATQAYPGPKTLANSAGILYWPQAHFDYMRGGIALYGASPNDHEVGHQHNLKPAMTLQSKLIAVRAHRANQPIGYGETWSAKQDTTIGVVAMGYGDGYPRNAPAGTPVMVNGREVPIVGRVSMDMITVDLGAHSQDKVGDRVEFWGEQLPIEKVAQHLGTISYELMIKLARRVNKQFIRD
ncbi:MULTISPECIES: alanine racemase [unclassified Vibrio]|uniref:Alanine racemase n=1 Tax=Vibrio sp. HB236076 TaxID=3232307 RepID=A0AB39HK60_9VIBR|nr:alanine racemase [Vibrio sp. HB161653]MDP5253106.1 alanine racemase [Vibrio sp. HB161653]